MTVVHRVRPSGRVLVVLLLVGLACVVLALVLGPRPHTVAYRVLGAGGLVLAGGSALTLKRRG